MSLVTQLTDLATRIATELKAHKILINNNATDLSALNTTAKTNLVAAINEVLAATGGSASLDSLSDVAITTPSAGHILRHNGTNFVNVLGTTHFQPADAGLSSLAGLGTAANKGIYTTGVDTFAEFDLSAAGRAILDDADNTAQRATLGLTIGTHVQAYNAILASLAGSGGTTDGIPYFSASNVISLIASTSYGRAFSGLANQAALMALLAAASDTAAGIVELATDAETLTGTATNRAVTPANLQAKIDALVASAPGLLNTLDELAAALGDDPNFATTMTTALAGKQPSAAILTAYSGLVTSANKAIYFSGLNTPVLYDISAYGRTIANFADAAAARTSIDVYSKAEIGDPTTNFVTTFEAGLV